MPTRKRVFAALGVLALSAAAAPGDGASAAVMISRAPTFEMTCVADVCTPTAADAVLNAAQLQAMLASANVEVRSGADAQDIIVAAPLSWSGAETLTLDAHRSLRVNKPLSLAGVGGLTVLTNDGGADGVFAFGAQGHVTFASLSSPLKINGNIYTLASNVMMLSRNIGVDPGGFHALVASYDAVDDGTYHVSPIAAEFRGTFDGLGNTVSNLEIAHAGRGYVGLFSGADGAVQHLNLVRKSVQGTAMVMAPTTVSLTYTFSEAYFRMVGR